MTSALGWWARKGLKHLPDQFWHRRGCEIRAPFLHLPPGCRNQSNNFKFLLFKTLSNYVFLMTTSLSLEVRKIVKPKFIHEFRFQYIFVRFLEPYCMQYVFKGTQAWDNFDFLFTYSGRTKYSACASKLSKLSREYLCPQKTQKAAVFFIRKIFGWKVS